MESMVIRGKYRPLFFGDLQIYSTFLSHLTYIAISHKPILVSSGNGSNRLSMPLGLLFSYELDPKTQVDLFTS